MSVIAPGRNLVLIGLMGAGKTTVGRLLAERLGRPFADTDAIVVEEADQAIPEIFAQQGERAFRELEAEAVRRVSALRGQVIAVGGGAVSTPGNATQLRMSGDLVLLDADPAVLAERVGRGAADRPMVAGAEDVTARLAELRRRRDRDYAGAAAFTVATDTMDPDAIVEMILEWARGQAGLLSWDETR
ncbi:MAG: shikimate kinase [Egibacteraceae bacterium]